MIIAGACLRGNVVRCELTCYYSMTMRNALIQFRAEPELRQRLDRLRTERHLNVSAWLRSLLSRELDRELGPDIDPSQVPPSPAPVLQAPLPGWRPHHLKDNSWGAIWQGHTSSLPAQLVGAKIVVQPRTGQPWTTTVTALLERSSGQVIVTDSGRPASP